MKRVAVLGAGVAGLTAADELSQRDFKVDVFERRKLELLGGKARSFRMNVIPDAGPLPAEHGFRFFPGFYWHLPETMKGIPYRGNSCVYDNLTEARQIALLRTDKRPVVLPASSWGFLHPTEAKLRLTEHPFKTNFGLTAGDLEHLSGRLLHLLRACRERRLAKYEAQGWLDFCGANDHARQGGYRTMMLAMTRSLVAARAEEMSTRTGGDIVIQLQRAWSKLGGHPDRLLNGPTNEVWIDPWRDKLAAKRVDFYPEHEVVGFEMDGNHLAAVTVIAKDTADVSVRKRLTDQKYDYYVCALPVEIMGKLVDDAVKKAEPRLANLDKLTTRWMNGFMLYLRHDDTKVHGHSIYVDSPWALTSVSQAQFWPDHLDWRVRDVVQGIISIDISDWDSPGRYVDKPAKDCTREEIRQEVLGEMRDHCQDKDWQRSLDEDNITDFFIDPAIYQPNPDGASVNLEPLFINKAGSWNNRPPSDTAIDNLVLAADYVQTNTDLATMEGANEAARRAVTSILRRAGSSEPECELRSPKEPAPFSVAQFADRDLFRAEDRHGYHTAHKMLDALGIEHEREHHEGSTGSVNP